MCTPIVQVCGGRHVHTMDLCGGEKTTHNGSLCLPPCLGQSLLFFTSAYAIQLAHKFLGDSPVSGARSFP